MAANNKVTIGRKWLWGGIATILILFLTVVFLAFNSNRGIKLGTSGVEITPPIRERKDSVKIVTVTTTPSFELKERTEKQLPKSVTVKDSGVIVQDQLAIINTGTNNGIMGNNNAVTVNSNAIQRHLRQEDIDQLKKLLPRKKVGFYINGFNFDSESIVYGNEIATFLISNNYHWVAKAVGQNIATPPAEKLGKVEFSFYQDSSIYFVIYPLK